jgi:hypothetical protein
MLLPNLIRYTVPEASKSCITNVLISLNLGISDPKWVQGVGHFAVFQVFLKTR